MIMIQHSHWCFCGCCLMVRTSVSDLFLSAGNVELAFPVFAQEVKYPGSLGRVCGKRPL